jgi:hypothetical protein
VHPNSHSETNKSLAKIVWIKEGKQPGTQEC